MSVENFVTDALNQLFFFSFLKIHEEWDIFSYFFLLKISYCTFVLLLDPKYTSLFSSWILFRYLVKSYMGNHHLKHLLSLLNQWSFTHYICLFRSAQGFFLSFSSKGRISRKAPVVLILTVFIQPFSSNVDRQVLRITSIRTVCKSTDTINWCFFKRFIMVKTSNDVNAKGLL